MRRLALGLIYLLLPGGLRAQEPGPASMVDGVFAAARAEAQAFWREYCAANESGSFRGEFDQLPSWPRYLARLEQAAAPQRAPSAIRTGSELELASLASSAALGALRCEAVPGHRLVRIRDANAGTEPWQDLHVRVSKRADGGWAIASWPPADLETLFSHRELFPHRVTLTIVAESDGCGVECRGDRLADSRAPATIRWERFDRFLDDEVWPMSALDERGDSREGVLIRVPSSAPAGWLLQVLGRLGRPGRRIPDVQLWITGGDVPAYLYLDQRGAWGEDLEIVPLRIPSDFKVNDARSAVEAVAAIESDERIAFVLPWHGSEPDPALWINDLDRAASSICSQFWMPWFSAQEPGTGGAMNPDPDDPEFRRMWDRLAALFVPHRSALLPSIPPELIRQHLHLYTAMRTLPRNPLIPGEEWLVAKHEKTPDGIVVRLVRRSFLSLFSGASCWLLFQDGAWKFCSWTRDVPEQPLLLASAPAYVPQRDTVRAVLDESDPGLRLTIGHGAPIEGESPEELARAFDVWWHSGFKREVQRRQPVLPGDPRDGSLTLSASPDADQAAIGLLVTMMTREDCPLAELRLQVTLDGTGRPGEVVFDQSVLRPGAGPAGSTGIRLQPGRTVQELCDDFDRQFFRGATRFHLLPPE